MQETSGREEGMQEFLQMEERLQETCRYRRGYKRPHGGRRCCTLLERAGKFCKYTIVIWLKQNIYKCTQKNQGIFGLSPNHNGIFTEFCKAIGI
jgi:hypothetical protein